MSQDMRQHKLPAALLPVLFNSLKQTRLKLRLLLDFAWLLGAAAAGSGVESQRQQEQQEYLSGRTSAAIGLISSS